MEPLAQVRPWVKLQQCPLPQVKTQLTTPQQNLIVENVVIGKLRFSSCQPSVLKRELHFRRWILNPFREESEDPYEVALARLFKS